MTTQLTLALLALATISQSSVVQLEVRKEVVTRSGLEARADPYSVVALDNPSNGSIYYVTVGVGTPAQSIRLSLDTGSSNTWMPSTDANICSNTSCAGLAFNQNASSSYKLLLANGFRAAYATGEAAGDYFKDKLVIGGVQAPNLTMGLVHRAQSISSGILGIGFDALQTLASTQGVVFPGLLDVLVTTGAIQRRAFGLQLGVGSNNGSLTLGGIDSSKYTGPLITLPITPNATGAYDRYRVDLMSVGLHDAVGTNTALGTSPGGYPAILDCGFATNVLPANMTLAIAQGLGAVASGLFYLVDCGVRNYNANVSFTFGASGGITIRMPVSGLVSSPGGVSFQNGSQACALLLAPPGSRSVGNGGGYVLGAPFLQYAYAVFDVENRQISLAQGVGNTQSVGNITAIPSGSGLPGVSSTASGTATSIPFDTPSSGSASSTVSSVPSVTGSKLAFNAATPTFPVSAAKTTTAATKSSLTTSVTPSTGGSGKMMHSLAALAGGIMAFLATCII